MARRVAAVVPLTGRYALHGAQMRIGPEFWARRAGARLVIEDDGSEVARSVELFQELLARGYRLVLPPYGGDSTRAVAEARPASVVWNHGAAADDVERLPGVVSLPTPASRYLVALGKGVAELRPGAAVALVTARGPFGRFARDGFEREADGLGLRPVGRFAFADSPQRIAAASPDAVLACGPAHREVELFRARPPSPPRPSRRRLRGAFGRRARERAGRARLRRRPGLRRRDRRDAVPRARPQRSPVAGSQAAGDRLL